MPRCRLKDTVNSYIIFDNTDGGFQSTDLDGNTTLNKDVHMIVYRNVQTGKQRLINIFSRNDSLYVDFIDCGAQITIKDSLYTRVKTNIKW